MSIDSRKIAFIEKFRKIQDEDTLTKFEQLLELEAKHFSPLSEEDYKNEVKEGLEDYKAGRTSSQKDFEDEIKSW